MKRQILLTARFEGELDQRNTQRLIHQPRTEVNLAAQDIPELGIGAGIDTVELDYDCVMQITARVRRNEAHAG